MNFSLRSFVASKVLSPGTDNMRMSFDSKVSFLYVVWFLELLVLENTTYCYILRFMWVRSKSMVQSQ